MLSCSTPLTSQACEMRRPGVNAHPGLCHHGSTFRRPYFRSQTRAVQRLKELRRRLLHVTLRLIRNAAESVAFGLRFNSPNQLTIELERLPVRIQDQMVDQIFLRKMSAHGYAMRRRAPVRLSELYTVPGLPGSRKELINLLSSSFFGLQSLLQVATNKSQPRKTCSE